MTDLLRVSSNLNIRGTIAISKDVQTLPASAPLGTLTLMGGVLYAYMDLGGLQTWYPLSKASKTYVHSQGLDALVWTVNHGLTSNDTWFQVQDLDGNPIYCERTVVTPNQFTLTFTEEVQGTCVVFASDAISVPAVQASIITAGSVNIGGGVVLLGASGGSINGSPLLTQADILAGLPVPIATATILGGVKQGSGVTIAADGTLSAAGTYTLPLASNTILGGVKVGTGLAIDGSGILSTSGGGGVNATNDTTTNATMYPVFSASAGSGAAITDVKTASTKMTFNPSTGTLFATQVGTSSDLALKTNIEPIVNPFNIIDRLAGIAYNWKIGGARSYGLGAQDVEKVLPELVQTSGDGSKSVLYTPIIAFLIEAVKSLKEELAAVKASK